MITLDIHSLKTNVSQHNQSPLQKLATPLHKQCAVSQLELTTFRMTKTRPKMVMGDVAIPISLYLPWSCLASCNTYRAVEYSCANNYSSHVWACPGALHAGMSAAAPNCATMACHQEFTQPIKTASTGVPDADSGFYCLSCPAQTEICFP